MLALPAKAPWKKVFVYPSRKVDSAAQDLEILEIPSENMREPGAQNLKRSKIALENVALAHLASILFALSNSASGQFAVANLSGAHLALAKL